MQEKISSERKKKAIGLIHRVYLSQLKNNRQYTACTKTRAEVRGGGRKPWKQKGTGNARAGSTRSPLWVGGGVIFGPRPRTVIKKINKKENRLAIFFAFLLKKKQLTQIADNLIETFETKKTKEFLQMLCLQTNMLKTNKKVLIISKYLNSNLWLTSRNLKNIEITTANCLNLKHLLRANRILISTQSIKLIHHLYGKQYI